MDNVKVSVEVVVGYYKTNPEDKWEASLPHLKQHKAMQ
jgi:hypothetical protein